MGQRLALCFLFACHGAGGTSTDALIGDAPSDSPTTDAAIDTPTDSGLPGNGPPLGECRDGWCWVYPLPNGYVPHAIGGVSSNDVWVIGDSTALHHVGNTWTAYAADATGNAQIYAAASNDVWAAAGGILHWDGMAWSASSGSGEVVIHGFAPDNVWVPGRQWDGVAWNDRGSPGSSWHTIAIGGNATTVVAVSDQGGIAQWLGGTTWGIADAGSHPANDAVVIDATHIIVAQDAGKVSFWDNGTWTTRTTPTSTYWQHISAMSPSDVWVAGNALAQGIQYAHWNGVAWSSAPMSESGLPSAIWQDPSGAPWVTTWDATISLWSGTDWVRQREGDNDVNLVEGTAENDIWTLSRIPSRNRALHWDGAAWTEFPIPADGTYTLTGAWTSGPNDYWFGAGRQASFSVVERYLLHWNGATWSALGPFGTEDGVASPIGFAAIWGAAVDDVYAVARTALYHYDGNSWTAVVGPTGGTDVFGSGANDVWLVKGTALWHWNGSMWTSRTSPTSNECGWANSPTDVWLGCGPSTHFDGTFFVPGSVNSVGIPFGSANDMFHASADGLIETTGGFGGTSTMVAGRLPAYVSGHWRAADGHIFVASSGLLVH